MFFFCVVGESFDCSYDQNNGHPLFWDKSSLYTSLLLNTRLVHYSDPTEVHHKKILQTDKKFVIHSNFLPTFDQYWHFAICYKELKTVVPLILSTKHTNYIILNSTHINYFNFFIMLVFLRRTSFFLTPSMVHISVINTHIKNYNISLK